MIANRELSLEDYLAIARRRLKAVLIPALAAALLGFLISFVFRPRYTSLSLLLVEPQVLPTGYVKPIVTEQVSERMTTLQQNVLSRSRLQPIVERLGLVRRGKSEDEVIEAIRQNLQIVEKKARPGVRSDDVTVAGYWVGFTADNPRDAQQICAEITSQIITENLELRQQVTESTTRFIAHQLEQAKQNLDTLDQKLAEFKYAHLGQLPTDEDRNLKMLMGLTSQLDANTEAISRLQQNKSFAESAVARELEQWRAYQSSPYVPPLRQELVARENQLLELRSRYTEDHPDVQRAERDIADIQEKLKKASSDAVADTATDDTGPKSDSPEVLRLQQQIRQDDLAIDRTTMEQARLQEVINGYRNRLSLSPEIEEQYKQLTRDNQTAHEIYDNLLTNQSNAQMQAEMERNQEGEQVKLIDPASLPSVPSFPVRWLFAAYGLAGGFCLGLCVAVWQELRDKSIRSEADVVAVLELPALVSMPWLGEGENGEGRNGGFRRRRKSLSGTTTLEAQDSVQRLNLR